MYICALAGLAHRVVVVIAVAPDALGVALRFALLSLEPQKSPAANLAGISLRLLRQEAGDQGREANGQPDDMQFHDELLYLISYVASEAISEGKH